ncbi:MAG: hypothetical protein R6X20_02950 [Phycisphaerae bacterium]
MATALLALASAVACAETVRPAGAYEQVTVVLDGAAEDGRHLIVGLHCRDGTLGRGWADGPAGADTRIEHRLERRGNRVTGSFRAVIGAVEYRYRVDATVRDGVVTGSHAGDYGPRGARENLRGTLRGDLRDRPEAGEPVRVTLPFWSLFSQWGHIRSPTVRFTLRDGKAVDGEFTSGKGTGKWGFEGRFDGGTLEFDGKRLRGTVRASVVGGDAARGPYAFEVDAAVRGGSLVDGTCTTRKDGNDWGTRPVHGTAVGLDDPTPADAAWVFTLEKVLTGGKTLTLYAECIDGTFRDPVARGGNVQTHPVDASGLAVENARLTGTVTVDLKPGRGFPPGGRELTCEFTLDAAVTGTDVTGTFTGRYGRRQDGDGKVRGAVRPAEAMESD